MKFSDEELSCIADNAVECIERALYELDGVREYKELKEELEEIRLELLEESNPYRENYYKQLEAEQNYENIEYQGSRL